MKLKELEVKISIDSEDKFQLLFATCNTLFGPPASHLLQLDEYFDTEDKQLKKQDLVIRIRSTRISHSISGQVGQDVTSDLLLFARGHYQADKTRANESEDGVIDCPNYPKYCEKCGLTGTTQTIALKSPRVILPSGMSERIELEFQAADGEAICHQLTAQGLIPNEAQEKERWTFCRDDFEVVLDKLPFIGNFVEIEGPNESGIQQMMETLDLSPRNIVRSHYGELMREKFRELKLPLTEMIATFAKEKEIFANKLL